MHVTVFQIAEPVVAACVNGVRQKAINLGLREVHNDTKQFARMNKINHACCEHVKEILLMCR